MSQEQSVLGGKRVLVAEDNIVNAMVLGRVLETVGAEVTRVKDGQEAVDTYAEDGENFNLILMDCEMPVMDGFDASAAIRRLEQERGWRKIAIIAQTAHVVPEYLQRCISSGMDDFVTKPLDHDLLIEKINQVLGEH